MTLSQEVEKMAEQLHIWYLEATKKLNPESYNAKAQVEYKDLTEEQKSIDRYIASSLTKFIEDREKEKDKRIKELEEGVKNFIYWEIKSQTTPKLLLSSHHAKSDECAEIMKNYFESIENLKSLLTNKG